MHVHHHGAGNRSDADTFTAKVTAPASFNEQFIF
jgi:hypothetical protein